MKNVIELSKKESENTTGGCFAFDVGWFIGWGGAAALTNPNALAAYALHYALDESECG